MSTLWTESDEARWERRQEYAEELHEDRQRRRRLTCQCHGIDMPGTFCPGVENCPLWDEEAP